MKAIIIILLSTMLLLTGCAKETCIELNSITGYSDTKDGLLLYTDNGNGYLIEAKEILYSGGK